MCLRKVEDTKMGRKLKMDGQTTRWPMEIGHKKKTWLYKALHRKLKIEQHKKWGWTSLLRKVRSSCSTSDTHGVSVVNYPVISHEWGKDGILITTNGTFPCSFVTQISRSGLPNHGGYRKTLKVMFSTNLIANILSRDLYVSDKI